MKKYIISKIRKLSIMATRNVNHFKKNIKLKHKWYGSRYGGFFIYPDILNKESIIYSFGIGEDISFDLRISELHNCNIFCFDPTPKSINWVRNQKLPNKLNIFEFGISNKSGLTDFYLPINPEFVSGSLINQSNVDTSKNILVQMKTLSEIMKDFGHKHIDILKLDIEGAEYEVIEDILGARVSITQILIEFHDRFINDGKAKSQKIIQKLKNSGYEIFAVSDTFEEISLIKWNPF